MKATRPHFDKTNNKHKIKIGRCVPEGAVNLAYYKNKLSNIDSDSSNIIISEAPKDLLKHKYVKKDIYKFELPERKDSYFDSSYFYSDDEGYQGDISLLEIVWYDHLHSFEKSVVQKMKYTGLKEMKVPEDKRTVVVSEPHESGRCELSGTLGIVNVEYYPERITTSTETKITDQKFIRHTERRNSLKDRNYKWPDTIEYNKDGYVGTLKKVKHTDRYIPNISKEASCKMITITNNSSDDFIMYNGVKLPKISTTTSKRDLYFYGWCRYFSNNNYSYNVVPGNSGHYSSSYPHPPLEKYCFPNTWETTSTLYYPGIENWQASIEAARKFKSGATQNWLWISDVGTTDILNKRIAELNGDGNNPNNYTSVKLAEMLGGGTLVAQNPEGISVGLNYHTPVNQSDYNFYAKHGYNSIGTVPLEKGYASFLRNNVYGYWFSEGNICFKDLIGFYKSTVNATKSVYGKLVVSGLSALYNGECDYEGIVYKKENAVNENAQSYTAVVTYAGSIYGEYTDYNAVGKYGGMVYKVINTNTISDINNNHILMYPDENGLLYKNLNTKISSILEGELFYITDMFKDNKPLFYSYRLKNLIYDSKGPNELGYYTGDSIKLLNSRKKEVSKKYLYAIKLTKSDYDNLYYADIYTNFETNSKNHFYCSYTYIDCNSTIQNMETGYIEEIFVQPALQKITDYNIANVDEHERTNQIIVSKNIRIPDTRKYVKFEYQIECYNDKGTLLGKSEPIIAKALNHKYALKFEEEQFIDRNHIISPKSNGLYQTALDILPIDTEDKIYYYAKLTNNTINSSIKNIVNLYVSADGNSPISCEVFEDTGFYNSKTRTYTDVLDIPNPCILSNGVIICGYAVYIIDNREIKMSSPRNTDLLQNWYSKVQYGILSQEYMLKGIKRKYIYSLPEYNTQQYSYTYGRPYMSVINEEAEYVSPNCLKIKLTPLYVHFDKNKKPVNLKVITQDYFKKETELTVTNWSYQEGLIYTEEVINKNDTIIVSYDYFENYYTYRGSFLEGKFNKLDLNTNIYHTYTNLDDSTDISSINLFNKNIYMFVKPVKIIADYTKSFYNTKTLTKIIQSNNNSFDKTIDVIEGEYSGTLYKYGNSYLLSGEEEEILSFQQIQTLTNIDRASFPESIKYDENGYSGTLEKLGEPYSTDTDYENDSTVEFIRYTENSNIEEFEETYPINENGYSGLLNKDGDPVVINGELIEEDSQEQTVVITMTNTEVSSDTYEYNDEGYAGILNKVSEEKTILGHSTVYAIVDSLEQIKYSDIYQTEDEIPKNLDFGENITTEKLGERYYYGILPLYKVLGPEEQVIKIDREGKVLEAKILKKWDEENGLFSDEEVMETYYYDGSEVSGIVNLIVDEDGYDKLDDIVKVKCKVSYSGYETETFNYDVSELKDGEYYLFNRLVYKNVRVNGEKTIPAIEGYKGKYKGTVDTCEYIEGTTDDTIIYGDKKVTYKGTVTKPQIDTRIYRQYYKGELFKQGYDNRIWKQKYIGSVSKNNGDTRIWCQKYTGVLKLKGEEQYETSVIFVLDTIIDINKYQDNIYKNLQQAYSNLKASGINTIKMGICYYDNSTVYKYSFDGNDWSDDIYEVIEGMKDILSTQYEVSSNIAFKAIQHAINKYDFTTDTKTVVLITPNGTDDLSLLSTDINQCNDKKINCCGIVDMNDYRAKYIGLLCNETDGRMADLTIDFSDLLTEALGVICGINKIIITNTNTIYHKIDSDVPTNESDLLIGSMFMRHYTSLKATELIDSRVRGGGILETIKDNIRKELEIESDYYFDIGYNDGKPYNDNNVIIIKLDIHILKTYGGKFTENNVKAAIDKWIAAGTIPIIEYVYPDNTFYDADNNIVVEKDINNKFDYTPTFSVSEYEK